MDRKSDSKSNLNESTLPLLDDAEKEKIELKSAGEGEAKGANDGSVDEAAEKAAAEDAIDAAKKKKEEEKEKKRQAKLAEEEKKKALKAEKAKKKEEGMLNFNCFKTFSQSSTFSNNHRKRAEEAKGSGKGG